MPANSRVVSQQLEEPAKEQPKKLARNPALEAMLAKQQSQLQKPKVEAPRPQSTTGPEVAERVIYKSKAKKKKKKTTKKELFNSDDSEEDKGIKTTSKAPPSVTLAKTAVGQQPLEMAFDEEEKKDNLVLPKMPKMPKLSLASE